MSEVSIPLFRSALRATPPTYLRWYHRHEVHIDADIPEPALLVSNHGFGGLVDLNVLALFGISVRAGLKRPTASLVYQLAWTVGAGPIAAAMGGQPASRESAATFAAGHNVLVFSDGEVDAAEPWRHRNRVHFDARCGFARLAMRHVVPVVPIVTAGAGESVFVAADGQQLGRRLGVAKSLRVKALPVSISIPWGVSVGVAGILAYVALPTKLHTAVLAPLSPNPDEQPEDFATRIEAAMRARLNMLVTDGTPILG